MSDERATLADGIRANAAQWQADGSPFYATLGRAIADDVAAGGPCWEVLDRHTRDAGHFLPGLRLMDAVHYLVLGGHAPALAAHYSSAGGDGDAAAAWADFRPLVAARAAELKEAIEQPPQTNEVGRAAALAGGWLTVAQETGLPLRLLEIGASAGLLLRGDQYRYEAGGAGWGDPASPVRFVDCWEGGRPPFAADCRIAERRGCDEHPLDPTTREGGLRLLSYIIPDETVRFGRLKAALSVAARVPVPVEQAFIPEWVEANLLPLPPGQATVLMHSFAWQYLTPEDQARTLRALEAAGRAATGEAPLARLSLEAPGSGDYAHTELRLTLWPGGEDRLLATCPSHPPPVRWLAS